MKRIAILTMAALLLAGCAAETTDTADTALPETTVTESVSPTAEPEAPATETDAEPTETTEAGSEMVAEEEAMEEEMQAGGSTASTTSPSPTATTSPSPTPTQTASPSPTASPTPTATETAEPGFTLAEVSTRNTASECWVAISGNVYDLTRWIAQHPGGSGAITQLCGTDGTQAFTSRHGGQSNPTSTLAGYLIGPLR